MIQVHHFSYFCKAQQASSMSVRPFQNQKTDTQDSSYVKSVPDDGGVEDFELVLNGDSDLLFLVP